MKNILSLLVVLAVFICGFNLSSYADIYTADGVYSTEQLENSVKQNEKALKENKKLQKKQIKAQKEQEKNQKKLEKAQQKALKKQAKIEAEKQNLNPEKPVALTKKEQKKAQKQSQKEAKKLAKAEKKAQKNLKTKNTTPEDENAKNTNVKVSSPVSSNPDYGMDTPIGRELKLLERSSSLKKRSALAMKLNPNLDVREVRASHILVKTRKEAVALKKDIESGSISFEEAAKKYSLCPSSVKGGDLGFFTRDKMEPQFSETAFDTKMGTISNPVGTKFGWHLIKPTDKR